jgi:hypothetical protein
LTADTYLVSDASRVLPGIDAGRVTGFIDQARTTANHTSWFKRVVATVPVFRQGGTA